MWILCLNISALYQCYNKRLFLNTNSKLLWKLQINYVLLQIKEPDQKTLLSEYSLFCTATFGEFVECGSAINSDIFSVFQMYYC